jgi:hypothetical protein
LGDSNPSAKTWFEKTHKRREREGGGEDRITVMSIAVESSPGVDVIARAELLRADSVGKKAHRPANSVQKNTENQNSERHASRDMSGP